jgi:cytochrome c oxidase subunit 2
VGPTWRGLYGRTEELEGGETVDVNEEYLAESIASPNAKVVQGFLPNIMPAIDLTDVETNALIAYIKSLQ